MVKASGVRRVRSDRELDRRIAALALPALGSIAAEPAYSLADTAIVGHLGRVPLDSLAIATAGGTAVAVAMIVAAPWIAALLGAHQLVLAGSVGYLRASAAGLPFLYLSYAGNGHLIGLADTRTPLQIAVTANVLNVALEVYLVYGVHLGLSRDRSAS